MSDDALPKIEYTSEFTNMGNHGRQYICVQGKTLEEAYDYFLKIKENTK